jgi:hypothetical protein
VKEEVDDASGEPSSPETPEVERSENEEDVDSSASSSLAIGDEGVEEKEIARADEPEDATPAGWYTDPNSSDQQRYWDGSSWTDDFKPAETLVSTTKRSPDERKAMLAQQVQHSVARGLRVESQSDFQAVLIDGKPVNHTLHAILTIFTCLLWGIVWAVIAGTGGEKREMIVVDEFGNIQNRKLGKV